MTQHRRISSALLVAGMASLSFQAFADSPDPRGPFVLPSTPVLEGPGSRTSVPLSPTFVSGGFRSLHFNSYLAGSFSFPFQVTASGDNVFVSDATGNFVKMYQITAGVVNFVRTFGSSGSGSGQFVGPEQVAVVGNDVYIADFSNNRVQRFDKSTGAYVSQFGASGSGPGQLNLPSGLVYNRANGFLYVSEVGNDRVQIFSTAGIQ